MDADAIKRDDPAWTAAAFAYLDAKQRSDVADKALEVARKGLLGLVPSPREVGASVSVVKLWKAGNVDYKSIPELRGISLDRYRGAGREEVSSPLLLQAGSRSRSRRFCSWVHLWPWRPVP